MAPTYAVPGLFQQLLCHKRQSSSPTFYWDLRYNIANVPNSLIFGPFSRVDTCFRPIRRFLELLWFYLPRYDPLQVIITIHMPQRTSKILLVRLTAKENALLF